MEATSAQHQEMGTLENMLLCPQPQQPEQERKPRPQQDQALKCPRCDSTNTKFCYYNNYSLSQPRYFCKSCRRYWTKGGTLRNVPVGGGCRKNKRSSSSSSSKIKTTTSTQLEHHDQIDSNNLHNLTYDSNDLTLAFARLQKQANGQLEHGNLSYLTNPSISSFLDTQNPNFYYGSYGNTMGEADNNGGVYNLGGEMVLNPYQDMNDTETKMGCQERRGGTTNGWSAPMKQEESTNNKVLWGYPWQFNGNGSLGISSNDNFDSTRESWINGFRSSNWHGLLNSPLM